MKPTPTGYVSVTTLSLISAALHNIERLEETDAVEPNEVQAGQDENGLASTILVLAVLAIESALNRTKYVRKDKSNHRTSPSKYFSTISTNSRMVSDIEEIFAVRHAIVHNHLWEAEVYWDTDGLLRFASPPKLLPGYGNKLLKKVMEPSTRLTRNLKLNLFPPRVWRKDAYIAFRVASSVLDALEDMDRSYIYISPQHFMFQSNLLPFKQIVDQLPY